MTSTNLEKKCIERFGGEAGQRLYQAMKAVASIDFCVATAWEDNQVSIATGCNHPGQVFTFTEDYAGLIMPGTGTVEMPLSNLSYANLAGYLARGSRRGDQRHCALDDR